MPSEPRHYWDSCLFIDYLNNTPDRADILQTLLDRASRNGPASIVVSAIAKVEVAFAAQERSTRIIDPEVEQAIDALWAQPCIEVVELHDHIARQARDLIRWSISQGLSLKPLDAIHLATAIWSQVAEFNTYDRLLNSYAPQVRFPICQPSCGQLSLL